MAVGEEKRKVRRGARFYERAALVGLGTLAGT
jgi:hypothetical protein